MKLYIVQEIDEYAIYKVADNLVAEFEAEKKDCIVVSGNSISEVVTEFDSVVKPEGLRFNADAMNYQSAAREIAKDENCRKHRALRQK